MNVLRSQDHYAYFRRFTRGGALYFGAGMTPRERRLLELEPIATKHGVTVEQVLSRKRHGELVRARREMSKFMHSNGMSYTAIGRFFGIDHSSVMYLIKTENSAHNDQPNSRRRRAA